MKTFLIGLYKWLLVIGLAFLFSKILKGQDISGSGFQGDPYILYNASDVDSIHTIGVNNYYRLGNDVDMTGISWVPLTVTSADSFALDGDGYTLSNLTTLWNHTHKNSGFIGNYNPHNASDADTIFQRITFYNTIVHFDSTTATGDLSIVLNGGVLIGSATVSLGNDDQIIYNVLIKKSRVWCRNGYGAGADVNAGGVIGRLNRSAFGGEFDLHEVGVDSSLVFAWTTNAQSDAPAVGGLIGQTNWSNNSTIQECFVKNSYLQCNYSGAEFAEDGNLGGLFGLVTTSTSTLTSNSYVFNNTLRHQGRGGGSSDPPQGGGIQASNINSPTGNSYVAANTYLRDLTAIESSDYLGWWFGRLTTTVDHSTNYLDTTGIFVPVWFGVYGQGSNISLGDSVNLRSTALMKTEVNYVAWDFTTVWAFNIQINDGYPYLIWENPYSLVVDEPITDYFTVGDTVKVKWTTSEEADTFVVSISYDNGAFFNIKDTVYNIDSVYISLDTASNQAIVKVESLINDGSALSSVFIILPERYIEIVSVGITSNNIASIVVRSSGMDTWRIFISTDTTSWTTHLGTKTGIDSSLSLDTIIVSLPALVEPYLKAEEFRDSTSFGLVIDFKDDGTLIQNPNQICYEHEQYLFGSRWIRDVSCGWVGSIPIEYGTSTIDSITVGEMLSISYDTTMVSPGDSIPFTFPLNDHEYSADSVQIGSRRYIISDSTLYMRDLLNNIYYEVADLSSYFVTGIFGMQNNNGLAEFDGFLIIASDWKAWLFTMIDEPNLNDPFLYDIYQLSGITISVKRNYFRGIYPNAIIEMTSGK